MKVIFLSIIISLLIGCSATPPSNTTGQISSTNKPNELVASQSVQGVVLPTNADKKTKIPAQASISRIENPAPDIAGGSAVCLFDPKLMVYRCPPNDPAIVVSSNNCQQQMDNFYYCDSVLTTASPTTTYTGSTGGSVSVRGYFRKNGTYVRSHTRRSPRRR